MALPAALAVALLAAAPGSSEAQELTGQVVRGPDTVTYTLDLDGPPRAFDFLRASLVQPGQIIVIQNVTGPPNPQCQIQQNEIFCQFPNTWPAGTPLGITFQTQQPYPDNGGMQGRACPSPCQGQDVGPFFFPGPAPAGGPPPGQTGNFTTIDPGIDLFATDPSTFFQFDGNFAIPPNVICPGCEGFQGAVHFSGNPFGPLNNRDLGDTDTIVRRNQPLEIPLDGQPSAPVEIELVALSLQSIEPIQVVVNGQDSFFDVFVQVSPSRPSPGQMTATRSNSRGGTFDSQLTVYPKLIFKRDGEITGELDLGAGQPTPEVQQALTLTQQNGAFRFGCRPPALRIPGLNDAFCPGLTPDRRKRLTVEQAALARHGVYPAQPRLEHFQCYDVRQRGRFRSRVVTLRDQFGRKRVRVFRHRRLCNPSRKNRERWVNRLAHIECYDVTRRRAREHVVIRNQWGSRRLRTTRLRELCVPSRKTSLRGRPPRNVTFTDHFACYDLRRARSERRRARVRDQFGSATMRIGRPVSLCNPVQKNRERVEHPIHHLVCYRATRRIRRGFVRIRNQFGSRQIVRVLRRERFCLPSHKIEVRELRR